MSIQKNVIYYNATDNPIVPLLFDIYPVLPGGVAFSLRQLSSSYTGFAMLIRRDSDDLEYLVEFKNSQFDLIGLLTFVGVHSAFVVEWYDQISNHTAFQYAHNRQPRIVNNGVIETVNGEPAINFLGDRFMDVGNVLNSTNSIHVAFAVVRNNDINNRSQVISKSVNAGAQNRWAITIGGTGLNIVQTDTSLVHTNNIFNLSTGARSSDQTLFTQEVIGFNIHRYYQDGQLAAQTSIFNTLQPVNRRVLIGAINNFTNNGEISFINAHVQELIVIKEIIQPDINGINTNILNHYGI
jgi:hypothetical protein